MVVGRDHKYKELANVEILVAGGGASGVAAAETVARQGHNVMIVEKYGFLGGAAVAGLSGTICGMYLTSEKPNVSEQIVFGFTEKFRSILESKGGITNPQRFGKTWTVTHHPYLWKKVAEDLLLENKVNILYHSQIIGIIKEFDHIYGILVSTKSGIFAIHADIIIDATGDANIVYQAGYEYTLGQHGEIQNPTMIFRIGGVDTESFLNYWGEDTVCSFEVSDMLKKSNEEKEFRLPRSKIWLFTTPKQNELLVNATRVIGKDGRDLNVLKAFDYSEAEIEGRKQAEEYAGFIKKYIPGCEDSFIHDTGVEVGVRQTRSIVGEEQLTNKDVLNCRKREDGIVRCSWPIELHKGSIPQVEWLVDDYFEVPYGALLPKKGDNLIVAGRSLYAEHEALASARVTAQCFEYGHAAGIAASQSLKEKKLMREIEGSQIRELLNSDGANL